MDNVGRIVFGVRPGVIKTVSSAGTYRDGAWHQAVATLDGSGMTLNVDGQKVAGDPSVTGGENFTGYWRLGGDNLASWPIAPSSGYFDGTLDEVAVYPTALSANAVSRHYAASWRAP